MAKLTDEKLIRELMDEHGWSREATINGYDVFCESCVSDNTIDGALTICRVDALYCDDRFDYGINDDMEACEQAEKDGVKFINDVDGLERGRYIDTPENRKHCKQYIAEYPDARIENWLFSDDVTVWFRDYYINKYGDPRTH